MPSDDSDVVYVTGGANKIVEVDAPTLVTAKQHEEIVAWLTDNQGFLADPKWDALKVLEEVLELCFACGASYLDISKVIDEGYNKASIKNEYNPGNPDREAIFEELGDVLVTITSLKYKVRIDTRESVQNVLAKLASRSWSPNPNTGILERPR